MPGSVRVHVGLSHIAQSRNEKNKWRRERRIEEKWYFGHPTHIELISFFSAALAAPQQWTLFAGAVNKGVKNISSFIIFLFTILFCFVTPAGPVIRFDLNGMKKMMIKPPRKKPTMKLWRDLFEFEWILSWPFVCNSQVDIWWNNTSRYMCLSQHWKSFVLNFIRARRL